VIGSACTARPSGDATNTRTSASKDLLTMPAEPIDRPSSRMG
jgi:hypothetical protein